LQLDDLEIPAQPHTLEEYAKDHFVPPAARTIGRSGIRKDRNTIWAFQKVNQSVFVEAIKYKIL
jgi:hypothetical protein